jgi:hypothetical protein
MTASQPLDTGVSVRCDSLRFAWNGNHADGNDQHDQERDCRGAPHAARQRKVFQSCRCCRLQVACCMLQNSRPDFSSAALSTSAPHCKAELMVLVLIVSYTLVHIARTGLMPTNSNCPSQVTGTSHCGGQLLLCCEDSSPRLN